MPWTRQARRLAGMQEKFTDGMHRAIERAGHEARALNHDYLGTEHLLLGLAEADTGPLDAIGVDGVAAIGQVHDIIGPGEQPPEGDSLRLTTRATRVLESAEREASELGQGHIGTEHLLLGLIGEGDGVAGRVLAGLGATLESARARF